ncbi:MAG: nitronate monooxygenase, partial [Pseudomonadales bacterium]
MQIELPIIQAPMAGVQGSALAVAVSNAGGLGSLPCAMLSHEALRAELRAIRAHTDKPFNVNFFCHAAPRPDALREAAWRAELAPYYGEFGIDPASIVEGPGRAPFSHDTADVLEEFKPPVLSFHFGLPAPDLVARARAMGAKILATATTVAEARWLEAHGADAIIA